MHKESDKKLMEDFYPRSIWKNTRIDFRKDLQGIQKYSRRGILDGVPENNLETVSRRFLEGAPGGVSEGVFE